MLVHVDCIRKSNSRKDCKMQKAPVFRFLWKTGGYAYFCVLLILTVDVNNVRLYIKRHKNQLAGEGII